LTPLITSTHFLIPDTLLNLFSKVQSSKRPHAVVLEGFTTFINRKLQTNIEYTPWFDENDLMGPFTNYLPQRNLITMNIVSMLNYMKKCSWFVAFVNVSPYLS
jgi:hypothetical protein